MIDPAELLNKIEDLDPELQPYLEYLELGPCIRHPLVYSMFHFPQMNAFVNAQLRGKREALEHAEADSDWHSFIYLHERPYRVDAFQEIEDDLSDEDYWKLLGGIWIDSETIRAAPGVWQELLSSERPMRHLLMTEAERDDLDKMPLVIAVYQGHTVSRHDGWSWTTDRATAEWFAYRFASLEKDKPALTAGTCTRFDVLAYFSRRNEAEILVDRDLVTITGTRKLPIVNRLND